VSLRLSRLELGLELLQRKEEVLLLASTGVAAQNIGGRNIHTASGIDVATSSIALVDRIH